MASQSGIFEDCRPLENHWVFVGPYITDDDWDRRRVLNAHLGGLTRSDSEKLVVAALQRENDLLGDQVRHVAPAAGRRPGEYLRRGSVRLQDGPHWQL